MALITKLTPGRSSESVHRGLGAVKHIILCRIDDGLTVFHQPLSSETIVPELYGGLIWAISAATAVRHATEEFMFPNGMEYEGYQVSVSKGRLIAGFVLHRGDLPQTFLTKLTSFLAMFEREYKFILPGWSGDLRQFNRQYISQLLINHLDLMESRPCEFTNKGLLTLNTSPYSYFLLKIYKNLNPDQQFFPREMVHTLALDTKLPSQELRALLRKMVATGLLASV